MRRVPAPNPVLFGVRCPDCRETFRALVFDRAFDRYFGHWTQEHGW